MVDPQIRTLRGPGDQDGFPAQVGTDGDQVTPGCASCEARQMEIQRLRGRVADLDDEIIALRKRLLRDEFERPPHYD